MKKKKTFKTPMMENCNNNFQKMPNLNKKFEVAVVGLQTVNGRYVLNDESDNVTNKAGMIIKANKQFTMRNALQIVEMVNYYMPNLGTGEFKTEVDGIKFTCNVARM